ncbi:SAM-dependent methyltransferase [Streptomyces sp. TP-A0874]|uniref:SAM-dependent methyltransferase n=1 Tax=Streptomyces sp. TP-A0874 TaxID=549819 RepID=UPI0008531FE7|nr:SAM-dependent methyltransferase [Streptomyces sp. TP-A0874]
MTEQGFPVEQIDTSRPHPARMYDYYLGGRDNYEVDRRAAEEVIRMVPEALVSAQANRAFLHRAVRHVVGKGVRQIIDIGTGIPTSPNTHEVAREVAADVRVAYVDNDPIVATHAGAKLINQGGASFVLGDIREPEAILRHPRIQGLIDFTEPVALLLVAVMHFITDEEDPAGIVATLSEALPKGSYLVLTHGTADFHGEIGEDEDAREVYKNATAHLTVRPYDEVRPLFKGYELLEPGLVQASRWRPDDAVRESEEHRKVSFYGGVGRKV